MLKRLQKVISEAGVASRRKAEQLIVEGRVKVNGTPCTTLGTKVSSKDDVTVDGVLLEKEEKVYYLLYKPKNVISATEDPKGRHVVTDFVPKSPSVYPVGRLDFDTDGAIFITNDGAFVQTVIGPSSTVPKTYRVKVKGFVRKESSKLLERGITVIGEQSTYNALPAKVRHVTYHKKTETTSLELTIIEGKYHQVKDMMKTIGHPVVSLTRLQIGIVTLKGLKKGEYRLLKPYEIKQLKQG
jgi:23S rRNA pseudouridine2605 synthase